MNVVLKNLITLLFISLLALQYGCLESLENEGKYKVPNVGSKTQIKILSFNILSTLDPKAMTEGYPLWGQRSRDVFRAIDSQNPDLVTILECSLSQFDQFVDHFQDRYVVVHNRSYSPDSFVMYRRDRFEEKESGMWKLENPFNITRIRRLASWVKLKDGASGREFMFVGTHVDAKDIRKDEIKKIKKILGKQQGSGAPLFLSGDFNTAPTEDYYDLLVGGGWKDSYTGEKGAGATYPFKSPQRRIDLILYFGDQVKVDSLKRIGDPNKILSDHRGIVGSFTLEAAP